MRDADDMRIGRAQAADPYQAALWMVPDFTRAAERVAEMPEGQDPATAQALIAAYAEKPKEFWDNPTPETALELYGGGAPPPSPSDPIPPSLPDPIPPSLPDPIPPSLPDPIPPSLPDPIPPSLPDPIPPSLPDPIPPSLPDPIPPSLPDPIPPSLPDPIPPSLPDPSPPSLPDPEGI